MKIVNLQPHPTYWMKHTNMMFSLKKEKARENKQTNTAGCMFIQFKKMRKLEVKAAVKFGKETWKTSVERGE